MKIKSGLLILIICAFVFGTCSTWEGDEGAVNIRIVGENGSSGGSRTIVNPYPDPVQGDENPAYGKDIDNYSIYQLSDFTYDIYFVKKVYPSIIIDPDKGNPINNDKIPKDNIGGGRENVKYGNKVVCCLVPGTWILIINGYVTKENGIRAQGVVYPVEIKSGKNEDIEIEMLYTKHSKGYTAPIINETVVLEKGKHF